jgi:hypothetical protein
VHALVSGFGSGHSDPQNSALLPNFPGLPFSGPTTEKVPHPNFAFVSIFVSRLMQLILNSVK